MDNPPTRVVVAEHQPLLRRALIALINEHPELTLEATAGNGEEALSLIAATLPDVALIDARLPRRLGHAVLHAVRARGIASSVIFLTGQTGAKFVTENATCISSASDEQELCVALLGVAREKRPPRASAAAICPPLSPRELEILELAASSRSSGAIAVELCLSPTTVRTYMNRIYAKLEVTNRSAAVAHAIREGLIA